MNNSLIGNISETIGVANGAYVWRSDLERYGRTDVDFYKLMMNITIWTFLFDFKIMRVI